MAVRSRSSFTEANIFVVLADGPITENDDDLLRARRELVREGLVVDSGLRKLERTGRYEILWRMA
jgi:hypothetical protein